MPRGAIPINGDFAWLWGLVLGNWSVNVEKLERVYVGKQLNGDESWAYELRMK